MGPERGKIPAMEIEKATGEPLQPLGVPFKYARADIHLSPDFPYGFVIIPPTRLLLNYISKS